jgi:hypothetical protein
MDNVVGLLKVSLMGQCLEIVENFADAPFIRIVENLLTGQYQEIVESITKGQFSRD